MPNALCGRPAPHPEHEFGDDRELTCFGVPIVALEGAGPNVPIEVNENGAGQSKIPYAFHLVDAQALSKMAAVLKEGADKYGADNWRMLPIEDHLNHLIMHAYAWLAGDRTDEHLSHIMCRATFAQGIEAHGGTMTQSEVDAMHKRNRTPQPPR